MDKERLREILSQFRKGKLSTEEVIEELKFFPYQNLGWAKIDTHRCLRLGFPEVVYGPGKTLEQLLVIVRRMRENYRQFLITRLEPEIAARIKKEFPDLCYFPDARLVCLRQPRPEGKNYVAVLCAGTADIPVAEEAALTCEILGTKVRRIRDVGVAGLHRLLEHLRVLNRASCIIVVAGMEGALPSVVAGLVRQLVVAVPSSVGYGAGLKGITALLAMLNSCSPNVVVVNIDNGFGAGFVAHLVTTRR